MLVKNKIELLQKEECSRLTIGLYIPYSATANQMITFAQELNTYSEVTCIAIALNEELELNTAWYDDKASKIAFIFCNEEECAQLDILDAIIIGESNKSIYEFIPSSIIKIGLPHGTDVPIASTICRYGGGFYFDYILSAMKQPHLKKDMYANKFPAAMRVHQKKFVCEIPFGSPKLDKFFNYVTHKKTNIKAIVYHISLLSVEEAWVGSFLFDTIKVLLTEFPEHRIIFRVHHRDQFDAVIKKCVNFFNSYSNFFYSDADSYIEDYAEASLMITHREYYNHLFDLATGCPTILYKVDSNYSLHYEHDERYFVADKTNFVSVINEALNSHFDTSLKSRKERCIRAGIYNPGTSINSFIENIDHIVNGDVLSEWNAYQLNKGSLKGIYSQLRQLIISTKPFDIFAMAYSHMMHYSAISLLLLAESHIRNKAIKKHYYPLGLNAFYQLVHHKDFHQLSIEAEYWWELKGRTALVLCIEAIELGEIKPTPELIWLKENYQASIENNEKINGFIFEEFKFINLDDGSSMKSKDVILYGAGIFAKNILTWNQKTKVINPIGIIDGDVSKQGTLFSGVPVISPIELSKYQDDIIVCSKGSLSEIVSALRVKKVKNKLLSFIDNPVNSLLLDLLIKVN